MLRIKVSGEAPLTEREKDLLMQILASGFVVETVLPVGALSADDIAKLDEMWHMATQFDRH